MGRAQRQMEMARLKLRQNNHQSKRFMIKDEKVKIEKYLRLTVTAKLNLARRNLKCRSAPHALGSLRLLSV